MRMRILAAVVAGVIFASVAPANATPILQLYLEGATYNTTTESWELTPAGSSAGVPFRLWAIGNVDGPGGKGLIENVRLSIVYDASIGPVSFTLTPSTTGGFGGFTDPTTPITPTFLQTVSDGSVPILGDGKPLPSHGQYGTGREWQEFALGNFSAPGDSPIGDFINVFPTPGGIGAQINVYEVSVFGNNLSGNTIHFDLYDTIAAQNHAKFAPFSHDADGDANIVPEPSSLALLCFGIPFLAGAGWKRRQRGLLTR